MASPWQPYASWVSTKSTAVSKTAKAKNKTVRRRGRIRLVNAPKGW
jgi:ribosomal protein L36